MSNRSCKMGMDPFITSIFYIYIYQDSNLSKSWSISKTVIFWLWSGGWGGVLMRECVLWSSLVRLRWCLLRTARIGGSIFTRIPSLLLISGGTSALFRKLSAILSWSPILESFIFKEKYLHQKLYASNVDDDSIMLTRTELNLWEEKPTEFFPDHTS